MNIKYSVVQRGEASTQGWSYLHEPCIGFCGNDLIVSFSHSPYIDVEPGTKNSAGDEKGRAAYEESSPSRRVHYRIGQRGERSQPYQFKGPWRDLPWQDVADHLEPPYDSKSATSLSLASMEIGPLAYGKDALWMFAAPTQFPALRPPKKVRLYKYIPDRQRFSDEGDLINLENFKPMVRPQELSDGNWIMGGYVEINRDRRRAAVARATAEDFPRGWTLTEIQTSAIKTDWYQETSILELDRATVVAIIRSDRAQDGRHLMALAKSLDRGATFEPAYYSQAIEMSGSKPFSATLPGGKRYAIYNTSSSGNARGCLQLTVSEGEWPLDYKAQHKTHIIVDWKRRPLPEHILEALKIAPGETKLAYSYPEAMHNGSSLFVVFSVGKEHCVLAEIAIADL